MTTANSRIVATAVLLVAVAAPCSAQNSSLMQPTGFNAGRDNVMPGSLRRLQAIPMPESAGPTTENGGQRSPVTPLVGVSSRYEALAQSGPYPYDGIGAEGGVYAPGQSGADVSQVPYDAGATPYDPYQRTARPAISLNEASWTYQQAPPVRVFRKNDVITIRVDEITRMMAEGAAQQRKRTLSEVILTDWIRLTDFRLRPDPQANGDPAVAAESNENFRAQAFVQSRESLTFNIAATVVDIRPNGNLVLEARKTIRVNDNLWETALSGMCRAEDIAPDNVVLSKDLIDLEIKKEDRGHLRDSYSRGWLKRIIDRFGPF